MFWILCRHKASETWVIQFIEIRNRRIGGVIAYADRPAGQALVHPFNFISSSIQGK